MREREASNSLLSKEVSPDAPVNRSIAVESRLSAFVNVCKHILAELKDHSFKEDDLFAVHLALDEAFANAVEHGNKRDPAKKVKVEYSVDSDKIEISITDEGNGFEPDKLKDPLEPENLLNESGRGIFLIRNLMDKIDFKFTDNGTEVIAIKYLK